MPFVSLAADHHYVFKSTGGSQGRGSTIVQITPGGTLSLFALIDPDGARDCPGGVDLTTALVALRKGWVIVGSLPTADGTSATATHKGCLFVLNRWGKVVETITENHINGPWDMTVADGGSLATLFVTNVLNGTLAAKGMVASGGTVVRILLAVSDDDKPKVLGRPQFVEPDRSLAARLIEPKIKTLAAVQRKNVMKPRIEIWEIDNAADGNHQHGGLETLVALRHPVMLILGCKLSKTDMVERHQPDGSS
jgi:hypothetical protein